VEFDELDNLTEPMYIDVPDVKTSSMKIQTITEGPNPGFSEIEVFTEHGEEAVATAQLARQNQIPSSMPDDPMPIGESPLSETSPEEKQQPEESAEEKPDISEADEEKSEDQKKNQEKTSSDDKKAKLSDLQIGMIAFFSVLAFFTLLTVFSARLGNSKKKTA